MKLRLIAAIFAILLSTSLACNTLTGARAPLPSSTPRPRASSTPAPLATDSPTPASPTAAATFDAPENPSPGTDGIGDPYFEDLGNGGYDVQHYDLVLEVDLEANHIQATETIQLVTTQELSSLNLDFAGLIVEAISVEGSGVLYQRDGAELTIYLPEPSPAGDELQITIHYSGTPGEGLGAAAALYSEGWTHYGDGILVAGEPTGAATWYAVNEHPADKATYTLAVTVDEPYEVASVGVLQGIDERGGQRTYRWEMDDPIAPYLVTVGIAEFDVQEYTGPSGVAIRNYFGADVSQSVRDDFALQGDMIEYFETIFGPYPFDAYGVVVHDLDLFFALETATMAVFGSGFTDEYVVAHELSHMWFGDSVGLSAWQDIWLNEGFASYAEYLWSEHTQGREGMDEDIRGSYQQVAQFGLFMGGAPIGDPGPDELFGNQVYARGALTLHALRLEVGDADFFEILQTYYGRYAHSNATTADFIAVAEEVSSRQLDEFFEGWLYQVELPDIPQMDLFAEDSQ
ncbi:MAG: M1 family aminopeptidase [Anaerolineales bacterium]